MFRYIICLFVIFNFCFASNNDDYEKNRPTHTIQKPDGTPLELSDKIPIPIIFKKCFELLDVLQSPRLNVGEGAEIIKKHFAPDLDRTELISKPISEFGKWYREPSPVNLQYVVNFSDEIINQAKRLKILVKNNLYDREYEVQIKAALEAFLSLDCILCLTILPEPNHDIKSIEVTPLTHVLIFINSLTDFLKEPLNKIIPIDMYKIILMVSIRPFINELSYFIKESNGPLNEGYSVDIEAERDSILMPVLNRAFIAERTIKCGTKYFDFINFMLSKNEDDSYKYVEFI